MYTLYMVKCNTPNYIYVGITRNILVRIRQHSDGGGSSFTKIHGVKKWKIISTYKTEKLAKAGEKHAVLQFRRLGYIVAGAGWTSNEAAVKFSHITNIPEVLPEDLVADASHRSRSARWSWFGDLN